jgi:F-type H+-transporting ATPase subunit delta
MRSIATYAEALFEAALAENRVDQVGVELGEVAYTVRGHAELRDALTSDYLPASARADIIREVFGAMHPALVAALGVMAERGDVGLLPSIIDAYTRVAEERRDLAAVEVTTVVALTDELREAIKTKLSADLGKGIVLHEKVEPSIVGGIIISTGGRRLDASMASQLEAARVTLSTAHTGGDV